MFRFTRVLKGQLSPTQAPVPSASGSPPAHAAPWSPPPVKPLVPVLSRSTQPGGVLRAKKKARVVIDESHNEVLAFDHTLPPQSLRQGQHTGPGAQPHPYAKQQKPVPTSPEPVNKRTALKRLMGRLQRNAPDVAAVHQPPAFIYDHEHDMHAEARRSRGPQVSVWHRTVVWPSGVIFRASKGYRVTPDPEGTVVFPNGRIVQATVVADCVHFFYDLAREEPMQLRLGPKAKFWGGEDLPEHDADADAIQPIAIPVAPFSPARAGLLERLKPRPSR